MKNILIYNVNVNAYYQFNTHEIIAYLNRGNFIYLWLDKITKNIGNTVIFSINKNPVIPVGCTIEKAININDLMVEMQSAKTIH